MRLNFTPQHSPSLPCVSATISKALNKRLAFTHSFGYYLDSHSKTLTRNSHWHPNSPNLHRRKLVLEPEPKPYTTQHWLKSSLADLSCWLKTQLWRLQASADAMLKSKTFTAVKILALFRARILTGKILDLIIASTFVDLHCIRKWASVLLSLIVLMLL